MDRMHGARLSGTQLKGIALCSMLVVTSRRWFWHSGFGRPGCQKRAAGIFSIGFCARPEGPPFRSTPFCWWKASGTPGSPGATSPGLTAFALISEIPYDLAYRNRPADWTVQNIFFTLAIGLAVLLLLEHFRERPLLRAASLAGGCLAALLLRTEYDMFGVLLDHCVLSAAGSSVPAHAGRRTAPDV